MKITVHCDCGKPFRFDDDAVGGRLQHRMLCPNCGADATSKANDFIAAAARGESVHTPKSSRSARQFWKKQEEAPDHFGDAEEAALLAPPTPGKLVLGIVGAVAGGLVGMMAWYYLIKTTGFQFGFVAWAVGGLVGLGARLFVPQGSFALAGVAALCACLAIFGGQGLGYKSLLDLELNKIIKSAYDENVKFAKQALAVQNDPERLGAELSQKHFHVQAAPLPTDPKALRLHYRVVARIEASGFGVVSSGGKRATMADLMNSSDFNLSEVELEEFRTKDLPELQALADGKPTREEFEGTLNTMVQSRISVNDVLLQSMTPYTFLFLFLGVGTAWKLAQNKSDAVSD